MCSRSIPPRDRVPWSANGSWLGPGSRTAISALSTIKLTARWGIHTPFLIVAAVLAAYGVAAALILRDAPRRVVPAQSALTRLGATLKLRVTRQASALYAIGFGGFVAFSVYLPT